MNRIIPLALAAIASLAVSATTASAEGDRSVSQLVQALIMAGPGQPIEIENEDYLAFLETTGLTQDLPGVLASMFGSMPQQAEDEANQGSATITHSCENVDERQNCQLMILFVDVEGGDRYESAVGVSFTLSDGQVVDSIPVRLLLAG